MRSVKRIKNFFQPSFKLASKRREGALVHKRYHPPLTPYQWLLASGQVDESVKHHLREQIAGLDPVALLNQIRTAQQELLWLSNHAPAVTVCPDQPDYCTAFATA